MSDDFEDLFDDVDKLHHRLAKRMFEEMRDIEEAVRKGKLEGEWDIKPIEEPGVEGYVARGRFQLGNKPSPKILKLPRQIRDDKVREPLTDVFQDSESVKLYVELPGVEKTGIQLNVSKSRAEVKAKNFYKAIDLPTADIEIDRATTSYKNGVLEVTIPKTKKTTAEEKKTTIKIE